MSNKKIATDVLLLLTLVLDIINTISARSAISACLYGIADLALVIYFAIELPEVIRIARK